MLLQAQILLVVLTLSKNYQVNVHLKFGSLKFFPIKFKIFVLELVQMIQES